MAKEAIITEILSDYASKQVLNTNFENLNSAFDNTLSLDGSAPNSMEADLDMNGHRVLNVPAPEAPTDLVRLEDLSGLTLNISTISGLPSTVFLDNVVSLQAANLSTYSYAILNGYATPGDGGGARYKKVAIKPQHLCYWIDGAGNIWENIEPEIDPRMFGAKANVVEAGQCTIDAGNLSQIVINDNNGAFRGLTSANIGQPITLWDFFPVHTLANTTIASIGTTTVSGLTGTLNGTTTISMTSTAGLFLYMTATDVTHPTLIPANTVITGITANVSITISTPATGSATGDTLQFTMVNLANLTAAASAGTTTGCNCAFGTDDSSAISTVITATGLPVACGNGGTGAHNSSDTTAFTHGNRIMHLTTGDTYQTGRYGLSNEIFLYNGTYVKCDQGACLFALGNISASILVGQPGDNIGPSSTYTITATLDNLRVECNGFVPTGVQSSNSIYFTVKNGIDVRNATLSGMILGDGTNKASTADLSGKIHLWGPNSTWGSWVNNSNGVGLNCLLASDSKCSGDVEIVNYREGISGSAGDIDFTGQVHVWTNTNGGYLTTGVDLSSTDINFNKLTIDSPWAPNGTKCYGVKLGKGQSNCINHLTVELNTAASTVLDNSVTAVLYNSANISNPGTNLTTRQGSRIGNISTFSSSSSVRLAQVVESTGSNTLLDIGSIQTDGNVYDIGWYTQEAKARKSITANAASSASIITSIAKSVVATTAPLFYPTEAAKNIPYWLDASILTDLATVDRDVSGNVRGHFSRLGKNVAIQANRGNRPVFNASGWTGTNVTTQNGIVFDGSTSYLQLEDVINGQTDVRVFMAFIPKTTGGGPLVLLNNPTNFNAQLRLNTSGTKLSANDGTGAGSNVATITASVPTLVTGSWSSTSAETTGSFCKVWQASTVATQTANTLINSLQACNMGAFINGGTLSNQVSFVLAEMIIVTGAFDNTNSGTVRAQESLYEGYLAWKWWLPSSGHSTVLDSGHAYYSAAPTA